MCMSKCESLKLKTEVVWLKPPPVYPPPFSVTYLCLAKSHSPAKKENKQQANMKCTIHSEST